jgi:DNA-binding beta-propeller fold protein YncE
MYEFLPIIGAALAMAAGSVMFWRKRRERDEYLGIMAIEAEIDAELGEDAAEVENSLDPPPLSAALTTGDYEAVIPDTDLPRPDPRWTLTQVPFLLFVSWWGVMNLLAYTLAGEKMPWLGTHLTVPLILLTAWYLGGIVERFDARAFLARRGWIYLVVVPLLLISFFQVVAPYFDGNPPFQGVAKSQLKTTYEWLAVVVLSAALVYGVFRLAERTGWRHLRHMFAIAVFGVLGVITLGSAWRASFIKYDEATEFLVYAHAGPGNGIVVDKLRELSLLTTGTMDIVFAHDDGMHWPGLWYFREFPNSIAYNANPTFRDIENAVAIAVRGDGLNEIEPLLEGQFVRWDYVRMWWPMQDYYDLTASRMNNLLDIGSNDSPAAATRRGIWDIWWSRDYDQYARAVNRVDDFKLNNWPLHDRVYFFVRRDVAARVWQYGVGGGSVFTEEATQTSACLTNWQPLEASLVFDTASAGVSRPIDMAVGPDGLLYVTEEGNNRVSIFDLNGNFVGTFGQQGTAVQDGPFFERPNGIAFAPNGNLVVADTWNSLIRVFSPDDEYVTGWGQPMAVGAGVPREPVDGFWGPRDVVVDAEGRVYVADTGNKRVRVYAADGTFLRDIGSAGSGEGQLDEPTGLYIHPDGRLFVADTWNRRVSVFSLEGVPMYNFRIDGWRGDEQGNLNFRPYLTVDTSRDMLYVPDMDAGRVLVYDTAGNCLGAFGQFSVDNPGPGQFAGIGGITVDDNGNVYVADIVTGRILRFNPFPRPEVVPGEADASQDAGNVVLDIPEITAETSPEMTDEPAPLETPETTAEISPETGPQATEEPAE